MPTANSPQPNATSFLDIIAELIIKSHEPSAITPMPKAKSQKPIAKIAQTIVLPNKRAKVFLLEALKNHADHSLFSPNIISIEDFVQEIAQIRSIDNIELLFEFYEVYLSVTDKSAQQSFDLFANWAKMLLQDFNEIDRYLLDPAHVLSYLSDIEDIKKWGLEVEHRTKLIEKYIDFWKLLPNYYRSLYDYLKKKEVGYQGLIYREAVGNLADYSAKAQHQSFVIAGFNALNAAEEKIIQHLLLHNNAKIYWDIDRVFLNDVYHDAGLFIRNFKDRWSYYKSNPFEWIVENFAAEKNIQVIGTPKSIGQAKIAGNIIKNHIEENAGASLSNFAVVLGDENLLLPLLYSLPSSVDALNITMGFTGKNNPVQILISKLFKMHNNAINRNSQSYTLYYKEVLNILSHPLVESYAKTSKLISIIKRNNYTFFSHKKLMELASETQKDSALFNLLFKKWEDDVIDVLNTISSILLLIKDNLSKDNEEDKIVKAFVYAIFKIINKLINYYSNHNNINSIKTLYPVYKQVIDLAEVSFEGEPLNGLQIMGVLESRVLDFDTVIVTSMNEGTFPAGKTQNSFIPYDVKRELGLPTYKEKDAIYTYHFYHLLQRAKNIYLIYNIGTEGIDAGEKSRFITQLEIEKQPNHKLETQIFNAVLPDVAYEAMEIPKSDTVMERLKEIASTGFSPSSLITYIRDPMKFYYQRILRISEVEEVEENIAVNTLGTIVHETLKTLFDPFIGKILTEADIDSCYPKIDDEVLRQFKMIYKEGEINKGRNLLAFEVAKRNVRNFLDMEKKGVKNGDIIKIIALEEKFERTLTIPSLPFPVLIAGNVDRIEERNGIIRIIDYKTGKVERSNVSLKTWDKLTEDIKNDKIIQILAYAYMFEPLCKGKEIEAGIISFKNLKQGFMPFTMKNSDDTTTIIDGITMANFLEQITVLLEEIFDREMPFREL